MRAIGWAALLVVALVASFLAGRFLEPPSRDELTAAQEQITVTAAAEERIVQAGTVFAGTVVAGSQQSLNPALNVSPAVVTRQAVQIGDVVGAGSFVGAVSGSPVFVLSGQPALYRDLAIGDTGDDVRSFQEALVRAGRQVPTSGRVDSQTVAAVTKMFSDNGFALPAGAPIPIANFVAMSADEARVTAAAGVGSSVTEDRSLATIQTQGNYVSFRADAVQSAELVIGQEVVIQLADRELIGSIEAIGEFTSGGEGQTPGRDVSVRSPDPYFLELEPGLSLGVGPRSELQETLAVPTVAVRQDENGAYVLRESSSQHTDGGEVSERVSIEVLHSGGGWTAIADESIAAGDPVVVN